MQIGLATLTPPIPHGIYSHDEWWTHLLEKSTTRQRVSSTSEAECVAASQAGQEAIYLRETLTNFGFSQTKSTLLSLVFCTKTTSLVLRWAKIRCAESESSPVILTFTSTMCVNSYWLAFSNVFLCARTKWWLMTSPEACCPRLSSGTARSWLVMFLSLLVYYVASAANLERWLWALHLSLFKNFAWLSKKISRLFRCVQGFWAASDFFSPLLRL